MPKLAAKTKKTDNLKLVAGENSHQDLHNCDVCELEDIIESSHDGLFITDGHGVILRVNSAWERIAGIQREFAIGKCAKDLVEQKWYTESAAMAAIRD
ncbi:MAG: PAS domain-containing protein, partial [Syntrophales bacterium]